MKTLRIIPSLLLLLMGSLTSCDKTKETGPIPEGVSKTLSEGLIDLTSFEVLPTDKATYSATPVWGVAELKQQWGRNSLLAGQNPNPWLFLTMPPIVNQGPQKSSLSWAAAQYIGYLLHAVKNKPYDNSADQAQRSGTYIHNQSGPCDAGRAVATVMDFLKTRGTSGIVGYNTLDCTKKSGELADINAAFYGKINGFGRTTITTENIKAVLSFGAPVLIVYPVTDRFEAKIAKDGLYDNLAGTLIGYRAALITAYSDVYGVFEVTDSKGESWGNKGRFYMSYGTISQMVTEAYVMALPVELRLKSMGEKTYTYNAKNHVNSIIYSGGQVSTLTYDGSMEKLTTIKEFNSTWDQSTGMAYEVSYGADRVTLTQRPVLNGQVNVSTTIRRFEYVFDTNPPRLKAYNSLKGDVGSRSDYTDYTYTGENITKARFSTSTNDPIRQETYEYDNKVNPFVGLPDRDLAIVRQFSRNNVTKIISSTGQVEFEYEYDVQNRPVKMRIKGDANWTPITYESY